MLLDAPSSVVNVEFSFFCTYSPQFISGISALGHMHLCQGPLKDRAREISLSLWGVSWVTIPPELNGYDGIHKLKDIKGEAKL